MVSAFTWDTDAQTFLSYGADRPAFLNTATTVNYGDGVWINVSRAVTWQQPALQRVGTQDVWFIRKITQTDGSGADIQDLTDAVLAAASQDLGPPVALQFGLVFQESRSLNGRVTAENDVEIPSVRTTFGVVSRSLTTAQAGVRPFGERADLLHRRPSEEPL